MVAIAIYLLYRHGQIFNRLYRKDLTIAVAIDQHNCDRLYSQIEPRDRLHGRM
jgi:hypothetical protein